MELYCPNRIGIKSHPQCRAGSESHRTFKDPGYEQDAVPTFTSIPPSFCLFDKSNYLIKVWQYTSELLWYSGCNPSGYNTDSRYGTGGPA